MEPDSIDECLVEPIKTFNEAELRFRDLSPLKRYGIAAGIGASTVGLLSLAFGYGAEGLAMGAGFGIIMEFFTEPIYRHYASRLLNAQETYLNQLKVSPQYREAASHIPELPGVVSDTRKMLAYFKRSV